MPSILDSGFSSNTHSDSSNIIVFILRYDFTDSILIILILNGTNSPDKSVESGDEKKYSVVRELYTISPLYNQSSRIHMVYGSA